MARGLVTGKLEDRLGNPRSGVSVTFQRRDTGLNADLFTDVTAGSAQTNPVVTSSTGEFSFWTERGPLTANVPAGSGVPAYSRFIESIPTNPGTIDANWLAPLATPATSLPLFPYPNQRASVSVTASSVTYNAGTYATEWTFQWMAARNKWLFISGAPLLIVSEWLAVNDTAYWTVVLPTTGAYTLTFSAQSSFANQSAGGNWFFGQTVSSQQKVIRSAGFPAHVSSLAGKATIDNQFGGGGARFWSAQNGIGGSATGLNQMYSYSAIIPSVLAQYQF